MASALQLQIDMTFENLDEATAYQFWKRPRATAKADALLSKGQEVSLVDARKALLLTAASAAKRMQLSRAGFTNLEARASAEQISIAKLRAAARAIDCECFVTIRPLKGVTFASRLWEPLYKASKAARWVRNAKPHRRFQVLIATTNEFAEAANFRKAAGWSRRRV